MNKHRSRACASRSSSAQSCQAGSIPAKLTLRNAIFLLTLLLTFSYPVNAEQTIKRVDDTKNIATAMNRQQQCLIQIDRAVALHQDANEQQAQQLLLTMQTSCAEVPQLWHNLGVFAAREKRWNASTQLFEQSLALDKRAAHTWQSLQSVYGYRSAIAYRKALGIKNSRHLPQPRLELQSSLHHNSPDPLYHPPSPADALADTPANLVTNVRGNFPTKRKISKHPAAPRPLSRKLAVENQVLLWWNAQIENDHKTWLDSYSRKAPDLFETLPDRWQSNETALPDWETLDLELELTQSDAVVLIDYSEGQYHYRKFLLLHESDNQWRIYRERNL